MQLACVHVCVHLPTPTNFPSLWLRPSLLHQPYAACVFFFPPHLPSILQPIPTFLSHIIYQKVDSCLWSNGDASFHHSLVTFFNRNCHSFSCTAPHIQEDIHLSIHKAASTSYLKALSQNSLLMDVYKNLTTVRLPVCCDCWWLWWPILSLYFLLLPFLSLAICFPLSFT